MSNVDLDQTVDLKMAVDLVDRALGWKPSRATIYSWTKIGARGHILWSCTAGGRKLTTRRAILNFLGETNQGVLEFASEIFA